MKRESQVYQIEGIMSINTEIQFQAEVMSDIRSIPGITTAGFHPYDKEGDNYQAVIDNTNYKGDLKIKIDTFPFKNFDKKKKFKEITQQIRSIPAVNFFRPKLSTLLEHETL
jgi:hypothetical protein